MNRFRDILTCLVVLLAVTFFDYATGYEVSSFPLYLIPIVLTVFYFGAKIGFGTVVVVTAVWTTNDFLTGHVYSYEAIRYWNAAARFVVYGLVVYGLSVYMKALAAHRRRVEDLRRLLPICSTCGKIMSKDGTWKTPQEILSLVDKPGHSQGSSGCDHKPMTNTGGAA